MRYLVGFICVLALGVMGCGETEGTGGGGSAGDGGSGGSGGIATCVGSVCPCTEAGIRAAIAEGGGPFTFSCDGPATVVTKAEIVIDKPVSLDGGGLLTLDGNESHRLFWVTDGTSVVLNRFVVRRGVAKQGGGIHNEGRLRLQDSVLSDNAGDDGGGIWSDGELTIVGSEVSGNIAQVVYGEARGGGIWSDGELTIVGSEVSGNRAGVIDGEGARAVAFTHAQFRYSTAPCRGTPLSTGREAGLTQVRSSWRTAPCRVTGGTGPPP